MSTPVTHTILPRIGDANLQRLADTTERSINKLEAHPFANVKILNNVVVGAGDTRIYHGLGYKLTGYWIISAVGDVRLAVGAAPETADPSNYFTLRASVGGISINLAVF